MATTQETKTQKTASDSSYVSIIAQMATHQEVPLFDAQVRNEGYKKLESIYQ